MVKNQLAIIIEHRYCPILSRPSYLLKKSVKALFEGLSFV